MSSRHQRYVASLASTISASDKGDAIRRLREAIAACQNAWSSANRAGQPQIADAIAKAQRLLEPALQALTVKL